MAIGRIRLVHIVVLMPCVIVIMILVTGMFKLTRVHLAGNRQLDSAAEQ